MLLISKDMIKMVLDSWRQDFTKIYWLLVPRLTPVAEWAKFFFFLGTSFPFLQGLLAQVLGFLWVDLLVHHEIYLFYADQFIFKLLYMLKVLSILYMWKVINFIYAESLINFIYADSLISKSSKIHCPIFGHLGIPLLVCDDNFKDSVPMKRSWDHNAHGIPDIIPDIRHSLV